jgi:hypothetical protein
MFSMEAKALRQRDNFFIVRLQRPGDASIAVWCTRSSVATDAGVMEDTPNGGCSFSMQAIAFFLALTGGSGVGLSGWG